MKTLVELLTMNLGRNVNLTLNKSKLLPFSPEFSLQIDEHSPGFFFCKKGDEVIFLFNANSIAEYSVTVKDCELYSVKWDNYWMVFEKKYTKHESLIIKQEKQ
jgi:hypothetical protein